MIVALTGATGALGRLVVDALLARGTSATELVAIVRDAGRAAFLTDLGITVRVAAYGDVPALTAALYGVDRLLLISGGEPGARVAQHASVVRAAQDAKVRFLAYTSAPHVDTTSLFLAPDHADTERLIRESGLAFSFLRNNWYTENYLEALHTAEASGSLFTSAGDGRVASASRRDYAEAAAVVLAGPGHDRTVYELSGDIAWSTTELAAALGDVLNTPVKLVALTRDEHRAGLERAGLDTDTVWFLTTLDDNIADGALADAPGTLSQLIGRPATPLVDGLRTADQ